MGFEGIFFGAEAASLIGVEELFPLPTEEIRRHFWDLPVRSSKWVRRHGNQRLARQWG